MQAASQLPVFVDERVERARTRVGQLIRDRWHLDAVLGVGGTAAVYAATHRNGKRVALKMLHRELSSSVEMRQRFVGEGYVANRVEHPGAVSVIDDDVTDDGDPFLIMDLLEGETVDQMVNDLGCLLPPRVLAIADEVLDILAAAHDKGIVHRDVKPDNIFVGRDGKISLLDFGIARVTLPGRTHTTKVGAPLGTPAFMPPEQARGRWEQLDGRTDLWALGATMFFLLNGRDVHEAETVNEELLAAMTKPAPSLRELAPDLPEALIHLVDRALAFDRNDRWPCAREMQLAVRDVRNLLESEPVALISKPKSAAPVGPTLVTPSLTPGAARALPRRRPRRPAIVVAVSTAATFVALLAAREVRLALRPSVTDASESVAHEALARRAATPEKWTAPALDEMPLEVAPASTSFSEAPPPEPTAARPKASPLRPKAVSRSATEARTLVAAGMPSPAPPVGLERPRVPSADPLDRRK
jgi:serine/threonine-protein kinase